MPTVTAPVGPSSQTRRYRPRRGRWPGLSKCDGVLFSVWLARHAPTIGEIHTHVPIGCFPIEVAEVDDEFVAMQVNALYPRRIDVALVVDGVWWLIEVKPDADHHALGQVLSYRFWWQEQLPGRELGRVAVITDKAQTDCVRVFDHFSVDLLEVGAVLGHVPRRSVVLDERDFL